VWIHHFDQEFHGLSHILISPSNMRPVIPATFAGPPEVALESGWHALYTINRHEKRIAEHLSMRGIEHFLPLYSTQRRWKNGSQMTLRLPLFPSYLFVRVSRRERVRVLEVPGVLSIVGGTGKEPAMLDTDQVEIIRKAVELGNAQPHPIVVAGQRGRIRNGVFAGVEGIVARVRNTYRVVLMVELIMKSVAVEVDGEDLEILSAG
jgi:transcription antitermination factor NusG